MKVDIKSQKAFSLVSVVVSTGLLSVAFALLSKTFSFYFAANKNSEENLDLQLIKKIAMKSNCALSIPNGKCSPGKPQELSMLNRLGKRKLLVSKDPLNPTKIGDWTLKSTCNDAGNGIWFQAAMQKPNKGFSNLKKDFFPDKLNGSITTWNQPKSHVFGHKFDICLLGSDFDYQLKKALRNKIIPRRTSAQNGASGDSFDKRTTLGFYDFCRFTGMKINCKDCPDDSENDVHYKCELLPPTANSKSWRVHMSGRNDEGLARVECSFMCKNL